LSWWRRGDRWTQKGQDNDILTRFESCRYGRIALSAEAAYKMEIYQVASWLWDGSIID